jgi:hypothetical protein
MADQLLATFYVQSPEFLYGNIPVTAQVQYRNVEGMQVDLVHTAETVVSQNPMIKQLTVNVADTPEALAARNINLTELNDYKGTVFVKSNLPVNTYSDDLSVESNQSSEYDYDVWLRLQNRIRMTRKIGNSEYKWNDGYLPESRRCKRQIT